MSIHYTRVLAALCVLATLWAYGCDDNGRGDDRGHHIGPSPISFNGVSQPASNLTDFFSRGVTLQRDTVSPQLVAGASCPSRPPFQASFGIVGRGHGQVDAFLRGVDLRFVDRAGIFGGSMAIAQPQLVERFGSTHIPRLSSRTFHFTFPFGCVGQRAGTLNVVALTTDSRGHDNRTSLWLNVH